MSFENAVAWNLGKNLTTSTWLKPKWGESTKKLHSNTLIKCQWLNAGDIIRKLLQVFVYKSPRLVPKLLEWVNWIWQIYWVPLLIELYGIYLHISATVLLFLLKIFCWYYLTWAFLKNHLHSSKFLHFMFQEVLMNQICTRTSSV